MGTQLEMVYFFCSTTSWCTKRALSTFQLYGEIPNEKDLPSHQMTGDAEVVEADAKYKPFSLHLLLAPLWSSKTSTAVLQWNASTIVRS